MREMTGLPVPAAMIARGDGRVPFARSAMERWLAMKPKLAPTAVVIAASGSAWLGVEAILAEAGKKLSVEPGRSPLPEFARSATASYLATRTPTRS